MIRTFVRTLGIGLVYLVASGHVGSPNTWFEGNAGPYPVTVEVQTAGVVPGIAKVFVRVTGEALTGVTVQANKFDASGAAPPAESAQPVAGDPGLFSGKLWMMSGGSNSVTVSVNGKKGHGKVVVPVVVVAYSRLGLAAPMGIGLAAMGLFLFAGLVTIVGAAVREGSLPPGEVPTDRTRKRARIAMVLTSVILVTLLASGWRWWNSEDTAYERNMYKPLSSKAEVVERNGAKLLQVSITDSAWVHRGDTAWLARNGRNQWTPLVEDHGKLMHLFVISEDGSSFAHLHPSSRDSVVFPSNLPSLPPGRYRVFADIVHESGFTHTLVSPLVLSAIVPQLVPEKADPDDSWLIDAKRNDGTRATLADGTTIDWLKPSELVAGRPSPLRFAVRNRDGSPGVLEPYMGMAGHAVVQREDGSVFVHLHPMGTISMASQMAFALRQPGDTIRGRLGKRVSDAEASAMSHASVPASSVSFPYSFPKEGPYRIWVQVKRDGKVLTAAFDAKVAKEREPRS
ncbi:MAG TPA: hypothetical protein VHM24_01605 [Gemmatimonadaceae bacterium]|nr:hypothetical protein [Gemmatimonadaceae bacterium]